MPMRRIEAAMQFAEALNELGVTEGDYCLAECKVALRMLAFAFHSGNCEPRQGRACFRPRRRAQETQGEQEALLRWKRKHVLGPAREARARAKHCGDALAEPAADPTSRLPDDEVVATRFLGVEAEATPDAGDMSNEPSTLGRHAANGGATESGESSDSEGTGSPSASTSTDEESMTELEAAQVAVRSLKALAIRTTTSRTGPALSSGESSLQSSEGRAHGVD